MIDSGSSNVLVRASLAERSKIVINCISRPLFTVGDAYQPSVTTLGESTADITIYGAYAAEHPVLVVSDDSIPVDVLVGRTWLNLPHISYYKQHDQFIIESLNVISPDSTSEHVGAELTDVCVALVSAENPFSSPLTKSDVHIDEQVPDTVCHRLVLLINEYRDVFAKTLLELGCTDVHKMNIVEVIGSGPVRQKPYRTSPSDRRMISRILDEWKTAGIISDSTSPYASPVLLVNKGTGDKRLCVDYRRLNQQKIDQPYPMPEIDGLLSQLVEGRFFSTMDLSNGFLQIPLSEEAKEKTAFVTEETTAKFERMPFGLKGAPGVFQKTMNVVFKDLKDAGLIHIYLDDLIIPSRDWEDMLSVVRRVFQSLRTASLTLKPGKCTFGASKLDFLGFTVSKGVIQPGPKVHAIKSFPRPRDVHEVRRFLGLAGYFRRFIISYASLAAPLTQLTSKDTPYEWTEERETSFVALRDHLCSAPVVRMFDQNAEVTQVHTDASAVALSGILLQGPTSTELHMVYAVSKKTTEAESKYHSSRLELYAVIWSLNRLRPYLLGIRFTVVTDCQSLVYLNMHKTVKPQIARWFEVLQEFDFDVKFRPGSRMSHVDALSRAAPTPPVEGVLSVNEELTERLDVFEFCRQRSIKHTLNSTCHPQANGQVERANRTIVPLLSILSTDQERWDDKVGELERHLNTAVNKTSNKTPFEALHGYRPRYTGDVLSSFSRTRNDWTDPSEIQKQVFDAVANGQTRMKEHYDKRHHEGVKYDVGEVVVMTCQPRADQPTKLQAKYRGRPLQVLKVLPGDTYRVAEVATDGREVYATTAHTSQLKSWKIFREIGEEDRMDSADDSDCGDVQHADRDVRHEVDDSNRENDQHAERDARHEVEDQQSAVVVADAASSGIL